MMKLFNEAEFQYVFSLLIIILILFISAIFLYIKSAVVSIIFCINLKIPKSLNLGR